MEIIQASLCQKKASTLNVAFALNVRPQLRFQNKKALKNQGFKLKFNI
jgi:hypothetical protein